MIARLMAMLYVSTVAPVAAQAQGGSQPAAHHETIVVHAGRLMTDPARPVAGPSTITIVDGRIQSVAAGLLPPPAGARLIDLANRTVLPGLIDAHVHLVGDSRAPFWRGAVDTVAPRYWLPPDVCARLGGAYVLSLEHLPAIPAAAAAICAGIPCDGDGFSLRR